MKKGPEYPIEIISINSKSAEPEEIEIEDDVNLNDLIR